MTYKLIFNLSNPTRLMDNNLSLRLKYHYIKLKYIFFVMRINIYKHKEISNL